MSRYDDLVDRSFGRLTVMYYLGVAPDGSGGVWRCRCECGNMCRVRRKCLISGYTKSCGCLRRDYQHWTGDGGMLKVINDLAEEEEETTDDMYPLVLRLTRVLAKRFDTAMISRAVREIRAEDKEPDDGTNRRRGRVPVVSPSLQPPGHAATQTGKSRV